MATNPNAIFSQDLVLGLVDERLFPKTGILNSEYFPNVTDQVETNFAGDKLIIPVVAEPSANAGIITNPVNGVASAYDTNEINTVEVTIKRGLWNVADDNYALSKLAKLANPEEFLANSFIKKATSTILAEVMAVMNGVAVGNQTDISAEIAPACYMNLATVKKNNKKFFGDLGREQKALVMVDSSVMLDIEGDTSVQTALQYGARNDEAPFLSLAGFNWHVNDAVTSSGTGSATEYNSYMVLPGGVSVYFRIVPELFGDSVRIPGTSAFNTIFAFDYAVYVTPGAVTPVGFVTSKASYDA